MRYVRSFPRSPSPTPTSPLIPPTTATTGGNIPSKTTHIHDATARSHRRNPLSSHTQNDPERSLLYALRTSSKSPATETLEDVLLHHSAAIKMGLSGFGHVGNPLLNVYSKSGHLDDAHRLFGEISDRDAVTWTTLITGYSRRGLFSNGLSLFSEMVTDGKVLPNHFTVASAFRCCAGLEDLGRGREIHGWVLRNGVRSDVVMENAVVDFYAKCGAFDCARMTFDRMPERNVESWNVMIGAHLGIGDARGSIELFRRLPFRDVVSWNTIISGQMQIGFDNMALELLCQMVTAGPEFNHFTFSMALALAGNLAYLQLGRQVHGKILRAGFGLQVFLRNSLIDMYSKCGKMESASLIFRSMPWFTHKLKDSSISGDRSMPETISWSSMVAGYVHNGRGEEALHLFKRILHEHLRIDHFTLTTIVAACSDVGILELGRQVHAFIEKLGHGFDMFLSSAVTDMYARCGSFEDARAIFNNAQFRNVVLWTSMVGSFALYGQGRNAIKYFEMMLEENVRPNEVSFVSVLSACSHAGLVKEGYKYFRSMQEDHGLTPKVEHFTCMVDLLGRAGLLNEAKDFILRSNITHMRSVWSALLSACRTHNNIEIAKWVTEKLIQLEPTDGNSYILLSNIYSKRRQWAEASNVRNLMQEKGVTSQAGQSWIQLKKKVHVFVAGDRSHPQINEIVSYLEKLIGMLKEKGYRKDTSLILRDVEQEERETLLSFHSEKLAITYGIISTPPGTPIRVMKNLCVCSDCHTAIKNGICSCGDFW